MHGAREAPDLRDSGEFLIDHLPVGYKAIGGDVDGDDRAAAP